MNILKRILDRRKTISADIIEDVAHIINSGGVGILPTDTLYGIVGSALKPEVVERIYALRKRNLEKPMIVLISDLKDLKKFLIIVEKDLEENLLKFWPGKVSVVLPCDNETFVYLHRGMKTIAFRMPTEKWLQELISLTGPLVAPSANFEGEAPAMTIEEAKKYFSEGVDFYVDFGKRISQPSTLIEIKSGKISVIREGAVKIKL